MPHLLLTLGDPNGIGAEITAKALQRLGELPPRTRITVIGSIAALEQSATALGLNLPRNLQVTYQPIIAEKPGAIAYQAIEKAVQMLAAGEADALVTAPISKHNLREAGHDFAGHTEILEHLANTLFPQPADGKKHKAEMLFVHNKLRLLLLTRHIPLNEVAAALAQPGAVARPIKTLIRHLREQRQVAEPRLALLGLNPHAGEIGGEEEKKYLLPVVYAVNGIGNTQIDGPYAADGYFRSMDPAAIPHDAIIACYHDQGLIPFKMLAGYAAVNVTIGLPFIRTSVSHGTAEDIVGKSIAREDSLMAALHEALALIPAAKN